MVVVVVVVEVARTPRWPPWAARRRQAGVGPLPNLPWRYYFANRRCFPGAHPSSSCPSTPAARLPIQALSLHKRGKYGAQTLNSISGGTVIRFGHFPVSDVQEVAPVFTSPPHLLASLPRLSSRVSGSRASIPQTPEQRHLQITIQRFLQAPPQRHQPAEEALRHLLQTHSVPPSDFSPIVS
ncbi:hypothetical protein O3P69_003245 [Scylla paramamosain]|uniref:Uncharacterized protein n=1 Tax=Scylla paramamosain TaxID=85552 RepID=A0AAW0ULS1_SCYPA